MTYQNISEQWGDNVTVTVDDVKKQAVIFGLDADLVTSDDDGIYYDGEHGAPDTVFRCLSAHVRGVILWVSI